MFDVARDTDDGHPLVRLVGAREIDARAERIFIGEKSAHEFFADDGTSG